MILFNRYIGKFFYLAIFSCILLIAFIVGCGGSNNPNGPSVVVAPNSATIDQSLNAGMASLLGKVVTSNSTPIANVEVKLLVQNVSTGDLEDTGRKTTTLTSGEFVFNGLGTGTFVLKIEATSNYLEASKLARIDTIGSVNTGEFILLPKEPDSSIPTLNLKAQAVDALTGKPLSVAQISVDTGQTTVTDTFGYFSLFNLASGTRQLVVKQPGMASYTLFFEVIGITAPTAAGININNQFIGINNAAQSLVDLTVTNPPITIKINPNVHISGALAGTVKKFVLDSRGVPTSEEEPYPGYEFDVWIVDPMGYAHRFDSVISKEDGTWRLDNLPPFEDNGLYWHAVPADTQVTVQQGQTGNVLVFTNLSAEWANRDPILAYGYKVVGGETTIMDFTVPSFVYSNPLPIVSAISDARFTDLSGNPIASSTLIDDIKFTWTGPGVVSSIILEFARVYKDPAIPIITKTFTFTDTTATTVHTYNLKAADYGLDYGRFSWKTKVVDPNIDYVAESDTQLFTVFPGKTELVPGDGSIVQIMPGTYTVNFTAPLDSEAKYVCMELAIRDRVNDVWSLFNPTGEALQNEQPLFIITFGSNSPKEEKYRWRVVYYYDDGPPMSSEWAEIWFLKDGTPKSRFP